MNGHDSILSAEHRNNGNHIKQSPEHAVNGTDPAPGTEIETRHRYFVPLIVMIVAATVLVSTYYDNDPGVEVSTRAASDRQNIARIALDRNPDTAAEEAAATEAGAKAVVTGDAATGNDVSRAATASIAEATATQSTATTTTPPVADAVRFPSAPVAAGSPAMPDQAGGTHVQARAPYSHTPPLAYRRVLPPHSHYSNLPSIKPRPSLSGRAVRRQYLPMTDSYRAAIDRQIERDRRDMLRQIQKIEREGQKRLELLMNRHVRSQERTTYSPI